MKDVGQPRHLTPLELILSCAICQDTITDVYNDLQDNRGLRINADSDKGIVVKLWLTECGHLICGKHLEGGGAPFHAAGEPPRAPCPLCSIEAGSPEVRALYAVYGTEEGQFDPRIPTSFFQTPPVRLDDTIPGMDALRFQYSSLIRYGLRVSKRLTKMEQAKSILVKDYEFLKQKSTTLENRIQELETMESKLKHWEEREPAIKHYLRILNPLAKENTMLKQQLRYLGYAIPTTNYAMDVTSEDDLLRLPGNNSCSEIKPTANNGTHKLFADQAIPDYQRRSLTPRVQSYRTLENELTPEHQENSSSGRKRKLDDFLEASTHTIMDSSEAYNRPLIGSRELMPPPPPPAARTVSTSPHRLSGDDMASLSVPYNETRRSTYRPIFQGQETERGYFKLSEISTNFPSSGSPVSTNNRLNGMLDPGNKTLEYDDGTREDLRSSRANKIQQEDWQPRDERSFIDDGASLELRQNSLRHPLQTPKNGEYAHDALTSPPRWQAFAMNEPNVNGRHTDRSDGDSNPLYDQSIRHGPIRKNVLASPPKQYRIDSPPVRTTSASGTGRCGTHAQATHSNGMLQQRQAAMYLPPSVPEMRAQKYPENLKGIRYTNDAEAATYPLRSRLSTESARNILCNPSTPLNGAVSSIGLHATPNFRHRGHWEIDREPARESVSSPFFKSNGPRLDGRLGHSYSRRSSSQQGQKTQSVMQGWRMAPTSTMTSTSLPSLNGLSFITDPRPSSNEQLPLGHSVSNEKRASQYLAPQNSQSNHSTCNKSLITSAVYGSPYSSMQHYTSHLGRNQSDKANIYSRQIQPLPSTTPSITSSLTASRTSRPILTRDDALASMAGGKHITEGERLNSQREGNRSMYGREFSKRINSDQHYSGSRGLPAVHGRRSARR